MGIIVSGFDGIGKTYATQLFRNKGVKVLDLVSEDFKSSENFPENYISKIKENTPKYDIVFISSEEDVRWALNAEGIDFDFFYPSIERKKEFLENYVISKKNKETIKYLDNNFKEIINKIDEEELTHCYKHKLNEKGEYLGNNNELLEYIFQITVNSTKNIKNSENDTEKEINPRFKHLVSQLKAIVSELEKLV